MQKNTKIFFKLKRQFNKKKLKIFRIGKFGKRRKTVGQYLCDGIKYTVFI